MKQKARFSDYEIKAIHTTDLSDFKNSYEDRFRYVDVPVEFFTSKKLLIYERPNDMIFFFFTV